MNAKQFFDLVVSMREAQKEYFRHRRPQTLEESKRLEKTVDDEIQRVKKLYERDQTPNLF